MNLSTEQSRRYSRNISLPDIGENGQQLLLDSSIAVIGCGALGSTAATYLAASGTGRILLADFDTVDVCNLQRQVMFTTADAGSGKADTLRDRLTALNPDIRIDVHNGLVNEETAMRLFSSYGFVLDCSDNPSTKYMTARVCRQLGIPCTIAGVQAYHAQISTYEPGYASFDDIFPEGAESGMTPCSTGGIFGPLTGIVGCIQAAEAIKTITHAGKNLAGKLMTIDSSSWDINVFDCC